MNTIYEPKGKAFEYAPLALNLYTGCAHACRYCYAPSIMRQSLAVFAENPHPRPGIIEALKAEVCRRQPDDRPVLLCFLSDPYQPCEAEHRVTRQAIIILGEAGFKMRVLTKGTQLAMRDADLFIKYGVDLGATLVFDNDTDRQQWEPNATPTAARLAGLEAHKFAGGRTWASLEPVMDPAQTLEIMYKGKGIVDVWKIGKLNHDRSREAEIDWPEFLHRALANLARWETAYYIKDDLWRFATAEVREYYAKSKGVQLWVPTNKPRPLRTRRLTP